jgi:hypothetical protein
MKPLVTPLSTNTHSHSDKLKVLCLLNSEFFEEVRKKEEEELSKYHPYLKNVVTMFGSNVGKLMFQHAEYEESFKQNNIDVANNKMMDLHDELLTEEAKEVAIHIRKTTSQLVRTFQPPTM